jgi:hypothetical protein
MINGLTIVECKKPGDHQNSEKSAGEIYCGKKKK